MAITLRSVKGSKLTPSEVDANFTTLDNGKINKSLLDGGNRVLVKLPTGEVFGLELAPGQLLGIPTGEDELRAIDLVELGIVGYTPENVSNKSTDGTLAGNSDTEYPSEKAVKTYVDTQRTPRVQSVASSATVTPNADTNDLVKITAQAVALTLANPTGTPVEGQPLVVRLKDNNTSRTITFGSQYRAFGQALPAATVEGKTQYFAFIYNSTDTKWDMVGCMIQQ